MECPVCGSDEIEIVNSKFKTTKKVIQEELILKCEECGHVFRDVVSQKKPRPFRLIISEQDKSIKTSIDLPPNEELLVGDVLLSDYGQVEVTSLEVDGNRVKKAIIQDINTIWAASIEIPARIGVSVDLHGKVDSYKVDLDRDFKISVNDLIKIDKYIIRVHIIKTNERKTDSGYARAGVIKRVYGKPSKMRKFDYDLTDKIFKKTVKDFR
ncbi:MAG: hypothetical protein MJ209_03160 [archaeon]|nr:hypothetical protein [archaeon]